MKLYAQKDQTATVCPPQQPVCVTAKPEPEKGAKKLHRFTQMKQLLRCNML